MKVFSFRNIRILALLVLLAWVAIYSKGQLLHSTSWINPLPIVIFPINADGHPQTSRYIQSLDHDSFTPVDEFFARESRKFNLLEKKPTLTRLGDSVSGTPPEPPAADANVLSRALWSLKLRYWAWRHTPDSESNKGRVRVFVLYYQGEDGKPLQHSLGLQKGLLGIVHAFADERQAAQNKVVIAHEIMHTLGAMDRYDSNNEPQFPDGYAAPEREPLYPQSRAEIMAGRIPTSPSHSDMAKSLRSCVVGPLTAREINWVDTKKI